MSEVKIKYLKDEEGNNFSPVTSADSVYRGTTKIADEYIRNITASGRTITFTRGNGNTGTITTQDTTYTNATTNSSGLMSANDKTKLDGIENGATARGKFTLLWQNPNGSAEVEFGYQTAALNQSIYNFDALVVYFWVRSVNGQRYGFEQVLHKPAVNQSYKIVSNWEDTNNKCIWNLSRYMQITSNTSIYFYPCYIMNYNAQSLQENNWCNYPVSIYGIVY